MVNDALPSSSDLTPCHSEGGRFAVIIPVYNHADTVVHVVAKARQCHLPIIVVDDGSTDATHENLKSIQNIKIIRHSRNTGKGAALISGMIEAAKIADWAICLDADGQHDPYDMKKLIRAIPEGMRPIVIGKRQGMENAPWTSRFGRQFSNFWVWASGVPFLSDSQSGFRCYPLPEVLNLGVHSGGYQYEIEVLAKAAWRAIPILEVPVNVTYAPAGQRISHFDPWRDFVRNTRTFKRLIVQRVLTPRLWFRPRQ